MNRPDRAPVLLLTQLQAQMLASIYGAPAAPALASRVHRRNGLDSERQLAIYRNATRGTLSQALRLGYPGTEKVCDAAVFAAAVDQYVRATCSRSGDLDAYGDRFGDFLDAFEPAAGLPYLADLARLEWLIAQLRRAPLAKPLGQEELASIPQEVLPDLRLPLVPRASLFRSVHRVLRIWEAGCLPAIEVDSMIDAGDGDRLLLTWHDELVVAQLSPPEWSFHVRLQNGDSLHDAVDEACRAPTPFDLTKTLARALRLRTLAAPAQDDKTPAGS